MSESSLGRPRARGFLVTTFVLGLLLLVPLLALVLLGVKAVSMLEVVLAPLAKWSATAHVAGIPMPRILAISALAVIIFLAGLVARSRLAQRSVGWLEERLLSNLPGYSILKATLQGVAGLGQDSPLPAVLLRLDEAWQIALQVDRVADGRIVVYVPDARGSGSGAVLVVNADRVEPLGATAPAVFKCVRALGMGAGALLARPKRDQPPTGGASSL